MRDKHCWLAFPNKIHCNCKQNEAREGSKQDKKKCQKEFGRKKQGHCLHKANLILEIVFWGYISYTLYFAKNLGVDLVVNGGSKG